MAQKFYPVKDDIIFHLFFADEKNSEFLISFLKSILSLSEDDYEKIEIVDPHLLREFIGDKLGIVDVKLYTKTRKVIHIEIQLKVNPDLKNRIILYNSKLIAEQIGSGNNYDIIKKVVSIIITDEIFISGKSKYHHRFTYYDPEDLTEFTDIVEIHTLELNKLPSKDDGTTLYNWVKFIAAKSYDDLDKLAERNKEIKMAVVKYKELTADERTRMIYEAREKMRMDMEAQRRWDIKQSKFDIARTMIIDGEPIEKIVKYTNLTLEEVESLN